jgi:type II secretory pathway predicted ATPase ExeA
MYEKHFGLRASPFGTSPDPRFLCMLPRIRETLAALQYGIASRRGFVVLTGEVGTGKTTLLKAVLGTFVKVRVSSAFVFNPRLEVHDFLDFVLTEFDIPVKRRTKAGMLLELNSWMIERYREGGLCVIAVDEAQNLSWDLMEEIRLLTNLETSSDKLLQIVLSGQPELERKLNDPRVRQLRQRIAVWCKTHPLTSEQTPIYISERLRIAGATQPLFTPAAMETVHAIAKGIPRLINLICEHAMICAYAEQALPISPRVIEAVSAELNLGDTPYVLDPGTADKLRVNSLSNDISQFMAPFRGPLDESEDTAQ